MNGIESDRNVSFNETGFSMNHSIITTKITPITNDKILGGTLYRNEVSRYTIAKNSISATISNIQFTK